MVTPHPKYVFLNDLILMDNNTGGHYFGVVSIMGGSGVSMDKFHTNLSTTIKFSAMYEKIHK